MIASEAIEKAEKAIEHVSVSATVSQTQALSLHAIAHAILALAIVIKEKNIK